MINQSIAPIGARLLKREDLERMGIKFSNVHLLRLERLNRFPRRLYLSSASVAWLANEVEAWIAQRAAERKHRIYPDYD